MTTNDKKTGGGVLAGLKVLDLAHHYSAAFAGVLLADLGADVTVVEHPEGNVLRGMLPQRHGVPLWSTLVGRNKGNISLKLSEPRGQELLRQLATEYDVLIENFRPGTLERWGLGPDDLAAAGADLVMLRVSGYGQSGPKSARPGFGGAAEAMSGLTQMTGPEGGDPILLSTAIADGAAGTFGALGVLAALWQRASSRAGGEPRRPGVEVVDIALFEGVFRLIPTQIVEYDQCGIIPGRSGSVREHGVIRGLSRTGDGVDFCVSSVGPRAIRRLLESMAADNLVAELDQGVLGRGEDAVVDFVTRSEKAFTAWAAGSPWAAVAAALDRTGMVYEQVYTVADIAEDEHFLAREDVVTAHDPILGEVRMPGIVPKFSGFHHEVRNTGKHIGADNETLYGTLLDLTPDVLATLRSEGVI